MGEAVQFQIVVENTGDTILTTVPLTDTYDTTYLTYNGASPASDDNNDDGTINWTDVGPIAVGGQVIITVNFTAAASTQDLPGDVTINGATASATDENGDDVPEDSDDADVEITAPGLVVTKTLLILYILHIRAGVPGKTILIVILAVFR